MRTFILAVTGIVLSVTACESYGTSVVEVRESRRPKEPVVSIAVTVPPSLVAGQSARAVAAPKDASGKTLTGRLIQWRSSSAAIARVDTSGLISAVAPGTATLSAISEGVSGEASMVVVPATPATPASVATVSVVVTPSSVLIGQTARATATLKDSTGGSLSGRALVWQSSDPAVATVNASGDVSAISAGTTTIAATSEGQTGSASLVVTAPVPAPVVTVSVSPSVSTLQIGGTAQLTARLLDANSNLLTGRVVTWTSGDPAVSTVSASGLVTAVSPGSTQVIAASEGRSGSATIAVNPAPPAPVASIAVSPATSTLQIGGSVQLTAVMRDANNNILAGRAAIWTSNNAGVATISATGLVTANSGGIAMITVASEGKTGTAAITVSAPPAPVASVTVSPATHSVQVGGSAQLTAVTRDANNNVLTGRPITWTSSSTAVATVSASGFVSAVAVGSAQVSASSEGQSGSAALTVTALQPPPPPPPPGSSAEPAGMTLVTERPFSATNENGWGVYAASGTTGNCEVVTDATAPRSASSVGRIKYPAGFAGGGEPCSMAKTSMNQYRTIYLSFWFKISPSFRGHPTLANKVLHIYVGGLNRVVVNLWGSGTGTMQAGMLLQGIVNNGSGATNANWYPNLGPTGEMVRGQWHRIEVVLVGNTSGSANGTVDWWVDGVKNGSRSGIQFVSGNGVWESISWAPTWGGSGSVVGTEMYEYMDHLYISGK